MAGTDVDGKTIQVDPVFNLGESLRRLYFPNEYRKKTGKGKKVWKGEAEKEEKEQLGEDFDLASDPVGCSSLYQKISTMYGLRHVQSQPNMDKMQEDAKSVDMFDYSTFSKSKSLPTTPKVSPKLRRKNKTQTTDDIPDKMEVANTNGPGFSFLASVAGNVRMYKAKQDKLHQEEQRRREEKNAVSKTLMDKSENQIVERNNITVANTESGLRSLDSQNDQKDNGIMFRSRTYSNESDSDSESSFVKKVISWGTKKKVIVSGKESNMYSPTSF